MSGLEIFGAVAAAIPLAKGIIKLFGTQRNAPRQVERLRRMLEELEDEELIAVARPREKETIAGLINHCRDLLQEQLPQNRPSARQMLSFLWPADVERSLKVQNDEMSIELSRLYARLGRRDPQLAPSPRIGGPSQSPRDTRGQWPSLPRRESVQRATLETIELPAVLTLQRRNGDRIRPPIKVHRLNILERDDTFRTLQYEGVEGANNDTVRITHRIPRGIIRLEDDDVDDPSVSFLDPHDVTIENSKGYHIRRTHTEYRFESVDACDKFLVKVRERDLLGRWTVKSIRRESASSGEILAQEQVVRLWRKMVSATDRLQQQQKVTVAFLGRSARTFELPLVDYRRRPVQEGDKVSLTDVEDGSKIIFEFHPPIRPRRRSSLSPFKSSSPQPEGPPSDADKFREKVEQFHPATSTFNPLPPPLFARGTGETPARSQGSDASTNLTWTSGASVASTSSMGAVAPSTSSSATAGVVFATPSSPPPPYVKRYDTTPSPRDSFAAEVETAFGLATFLTGQDSSHGKQQQQQRRPSVDRATQMSGGGYYSPRKDSQR